MRFISTTTADALWRDMVAEIPLTDASWKDGKLTVEFEGNRVDGIFGGTGQGTVEGGTAGLNIDGIGRKLDKGFRITWKGLPLWNALPLAGRYTIELAGDAVRRNGITALRICRPPSPQTEDPAADFSK